MRQVGEELERWFKDRPLWLQDAARRLIQQGKIEDADINDLLLLCKKEAGITDGVETAPKASGIPDGACQKKEYSHHLHLLSISNLTGINALNPRNPLEFGTDKLTIVYGATGAGKSGYVRALKHACGARAPGRLHPNVFAATPQKQGCRFKYLLDENMRETDWTIQEGVHSELQTIEIYDTDCAGVYINQESEIAYEPHLLSMFAGLTDVCDRLASSIELEINSLVAQKPQLPEKLASTGAGIWYQKINHETTNTDVERWCKWTDKDQSQLEQITARLSEGDPKAKAVKLRNQKTHIERLTKIMDQLSTALAPQQCVKYLELKREADVKRRAATEDAGRVFANEPLSGVGSESWRLLWEQARAYSTQEAYQGTSFPNTGEGAKCVLCQQPLNTDSCRRLQSFEDFVKGELATDAQLAERQFVEMQESLGEVPTADDLNIRLDSAGITEDEARKQVLALFENLRNRKQTLQQAQQGEEFKEIPSLGAITFLLQRGSGLEEQAAVYDADASNPKEDNRAELKKTKDGYEAKKWVSEQRGAILPEIKRLKQRFLLQEAKKLTDTYALSLKKSNLAEVIVTGAYIERFNSEVANLGAGRIGVELIKTRTQKGRAFHAIRLKNNNSNIPASQILSEGEFRIVSLAVFLADVEGHTNKATFVFDDPITSIDQDYEEATARRLVALAEARQVIIFTHRLSMLALVEEAAKERGLDPKIIGLQREQWGIGEPVGPPLPAQKPKQAINSLLDRVERARKVLNDTGQVEYEWAAKAICTQTRITLERIIENDLLADVIQRFRRSVTTQGKLHKLSRITRDDCIYIDQLMTKYSRYEHSQPGEAPVPLPNPDGLKTDLTVLRDWRNAFEKRPV